MRKHQWTETMTLHINGGSKFSQLNYKILCDGKDIGITRSTRTDGRPRYRVTDDVFHHGDETFDNLKQRGVIDWLDARAAIAQAKDGA